VSSEGFLTGFLLGLAGSIAGLLVVLGFVFTSPRPEAHVLAAVAERGASVGPDSRFSRVASSLAGKQVEVRCWASSGWPRLMREQSAYAGGGLTPATLGVADIGGRRIDLSPTVCAGLADLVDRKFRPTDGIAQLRLAAALVTLAHEPQHSKGIATEAVAECYAIQLAPATAASLGVSRAYAASLVQTYWRHYGNELPDYRSSACRQRGALDLHRADSIWP
jgi:hypothetical protein